MVEAVQRSTRMEQVKTIRDLLKYFLRVHEGPYHNLEVNCRSPSWFMAYKDPVIPKQLYLSTR